MYDLDIRRWVQQKRCYPTGNGIWIFGVMESVSNNLSTIHSGTGDFDVVYRALINHLIATQVHRAVILLADWEVRDVPN